MNDRIVWEVFMHTRYRDAVAGVNWRGINQLIVEPDRLEIDAGIFQANGPWVFSSKDITSLDPFKYWWWLLRGVRINHSRSDLPYEIVVFPPLRTCKGAINEIEYAFYEN